MTIDFEHEKKEIITDLKGVDNYLDCEKVIIHNIKKHYTNGFSVGVIETYLKKLMPYLDQLIVTNKVSPDCINYRYAASFVSTIVTTPYWHNWIKMTHL